jgi:hypothetical protein
MCASTDLWEPWAGNRPGRPGQPVCYVEHAQPEGGRHVGKERGFLKLAKRKAVDQLRKFETPGSIYSE